MNTYKTPVIGFFAVILALAFTACKQPTASGPGPRPKPEPEPAHVHQWGEWTQTTPPTCTAAGEETRACASDSSTETRAGAAALGHDWDEWVTKTPPTATKNGSQTKTCKRDTSHTETQPIPATGIKADPSVTWPAGLTATYGQTLSDISLAAYTNGGAGSFSWTTPADSVGALGAQSHSITFTPTDTADYNTLTHNVSITVYQDNIAAVTLTITGPVKGSAPVTAATTTDINYTCGAVSWSPNNSPFLGGTVYAATVTLTADSNYIFTNLSSATVNGQNAVLLNNTGDTVTLSHTFPATDTRTAANIEIKTQPNKLTYTHGDPLDLAGLAVTLTYEDGTAEDAAASGFVAKNITAKPAHGIHLAHVTHNGQPVTITYGSLTMYTGNLTVNKAPGNFGTPAAIDTTFTTTLTLAALNSRLPAGYAWVTPSTGLNAGNNQSFSATYTDSSGNYEAATGTITVNVAKADGVFGVHSVINTTYTPGLTLAALNVQNGYAWVNPSTSLNAGDGQSFAANYINPNGNYESAIGAITVNVAKAGGAAVNAPTAAAINVNSVTLAAVSASTGQNIEYGVNTGNTTPATWQPALAFNGLNAGSVYYFFARAAGNTNYETGAASTGTAITTKQRAENEIINYWVDDTGELSVGNGGQGVTVPNGGRVTFTANGGGYSNQRWTLNGNAAGSGASYTFDTFDTAEQDKEVGRNYIIGLQVQKGGKYYYTEITVTIVDGQLFTVTFNANGGSGTPPDIQTVGASFSITLPGQGSLARTGYTFGGWNTNTAGTGDNYNAGVSYTPDGNITLYAKWIWIYTMVTIDMYDSGGDGWNPTGIGDGRLTIVVNDTWLISVKVENTAANNTPSGQRYTNTYTFSVAFGDVVQLYSGGGTNQGENSFIVYYTDAPPSPAFTTDNQGPTSWNGSNALVYRLRNTMNFISGGTLLGSFTVQ